MTEQPKYDKLLTPIEDVTISVETLLQGAFGRLMGDQREVLKRIHAAGWALHTLVLEVVTNIGIENVARRAYLPKKFDDYISPMDTGAGELLKGVDGPLNDEQRLAVEFIHVTGQLLRRYSDNLWLYSQLSNDLYHLEKRLTPVESLFDPMHWSVTTAPVELELLIPEHLPLIHVDGELMRAAIMQIVENAINNTEEGNIQVLVEVSGNMMDISVVDTGCGIPQKYHQDIFTPFFQVKSDKPGLGLGLAIAQKCMLMHRGIVHIESLNNRTAATMRCPIK